MIKNGIIPWVLMLVFGVVVCIVIGVEFGVSYLVRDSTEVAVNAICAPKRLEKVWNTNVYLTVDCNGTEYWSRDDETILAWGNERKISTCTLYKTGRAKCVEATQG